MGSIYLNNCSSTKLGQQWVVMADGRIRLHEKGLGLIDVCVDLQYMRAIANNPVGLYNCAGLNNAGAADEGLNWPLLNATHEAYIDCD